MQFLLTHSESDCLMPPTSTITHADRKTFHTQCKRTRIVAAQHVNTINGGYTNDLKVVVDGSCFHFKNRVITTGSYQREWYPPSLGTLRRQLSSNADPVCCQKIPPPS